MIQVVWEFIVKESAIGPFMHAYGPGGAWDRLFQGYHGFLGTALLRDADNPRRFLTIDSWETEGQRRRMMAQAREAYVNLDKLLDDLTEDQDEVGTFELLTETPAYAVVKAKRAAAGRTIGRRRRTRG
jgi:hypothetical protein